MTLQHVRLPVDVKVSGWEANAFSNMKDREMALISLAHKCKEGSLLDKMNKAAFKAEVQAHLDNLYLANAANETPYNKLVRIRENLYPIMKRS